jgi:hypothetical protein
MESEVELDECKYCGWCCEYLESHIEFCDGRCQYINKKYDVYRDEDGELVWKLKQ